MIYNINLGIGWASSGVEYAQSYRSNIFKKNKIDSKFIFCDMFPRDNIEHMTKNLGFDDSQIIWLYTFFTDTKISPVTYTLRDLEQTFTQHNYNFKRNKKEATYIFPGKNNFYKAYMVDEESDLVHRVEMVSDGRLIRKDYYTYCRIYSEYYGPLDGKAHLYQRRFFNEDGSLAYEEVNDNDDVIYKFKDKVIDSKAELVGYMISKLNLTKDDFVIIDRTTGIGQAVLMNAKGAKKGIVIHADHFNEGRTNDNYILWNNYYEYPFAQHKHIDFYVTATQEQNDILCEQFKKYKNTIPNVITIPVGSIDELKYPTKEKPRKKHSFITASRLADEKHIDWLVDAVYEARKTVGDITLDIYGKGKGEETLKKKIKELGCEDYIHLCGHHDLTDIYIRYDGYLSASTSEGFGLTLLEAIGSGLPIIGFDVRYGNQTFIDNEKNGFLLPINDRQDGTECSNKLANSLVRLCTHTDIESFQSHSYEKAKQFLTSEVEKKWIAALEKMM